MIAYLLGIVGGALILLGIASLCMDVARLTAVVRDQAGRITNLERRLAEVHKLARRRADR